MFIRSKNKYLSVCSSSVVIQIPAAKLCFALFVFYSLFDLHYAYFKKYFVSQTGCSHVFIMIDTLIESKHLSDDICS